MIVPRAIRRLFPLSAKLFYYKVRYYLFYRGTACYCPVCGHSSSQFLSLHMGREEWTAHGVKCPYCYSFKRHRFLFLYLKRKTDLLTGSRNRRVLHFAAEPCLSAILRKQFGKGYQTADMWDPHADLKVDICNIEFPDNSFDIIICSHVLEHVEDDQKAMRELSRTLKPGGWAILMVPVSGTTTQEDKTITDKAERERLYGPDHRRSYGTDFEDRLRANGFNVTCTYPHDLLSKDEQARMGIADYDQVYHGTKAPCANSIECSGLWASLRNSHASRPRLRRRPAFAEALDPRCTGN